MLVSDEMRIRDMMTKLQEVVDVAIRNLTEIVNANGGVYQKVIIGGQLSIREAVWDGRLPSPNDYIEIKFQTPYDGKLYRVYGKITKSKRISFAKTPFSGILKGIKEVVTLYGKTLGTLRPDDKDFFRGSPPKITIETPTGPTGPNLPEPEPLIPKPKKPEPTPEPEPDDDEDEKTPDEVIEDIFNGVDEL